jgi:hypothetical protein
MSLFRLQDESFFVQPVVAGDEIEGIIALKAQLYGVTAHEFAVCCISLCHKFSSAHLITTNYYAALRASLFVAEESLHGLREIPCWLRRGFIQ